jgi:hypothetical protein
MGPWVPSRKTLLVGAGALVLVVLVAVLLTRGDGRSLTIERGDGSAFPLRGSLADDRDAIDDALAAWKDGRGAAANGRAARVSGAAVHLLYAGRAGDRDVVLVRQGTRLIAMHRPLDRDWVVGAARERFDAFDGSPVGIDDAILLPAGDWTYVPLRARGSRPQTADGLISTGAAVGGELEPGFVLQGSQPARDQLGKVYDTQAGLFRVDADDYRRITAASRRPGSLTAIHAALVESDRAEAVDGTRLRAMDVLWTGRLPGVPHAAVVLRGDPHRLGLGLVRDPDAFVSSAESVDLGSLTAPLGARRRELVDPPYVGAAYAGGGDEPVTLVAAATGEVDRIELLVGTRRVTRPGPVAIIPADWDPATADAVVLGRTARGAVVAPLVPGSP